MTDPDPDPPPSNPYAIIKKLRKKIAQLEASLAHVKSQRAQLVNFLSREREWRKGLEIILDEIRRDDD